jgi:hypothetical protein
MFILTLDENETTVLKHFHFFCLYLISEKGIHHNFKINPPEQKYANNLKKEQLCEPGILINQRPNI